MIGNWFGYYKYNNPRVQHAIGFEQTYFTIAITSFDGTSFSGTVKDDTNTGGMKEPGIIKGTIQSGRITFRKYMPKQDQIIDYQGTRRTTDKKHPTLFYSGIFSFDNNQIDGKWEFGYQIVLLFGFIPIVYKPGRGTFSMHIMGKAE